MEPTENQKWIAQYQWAGPLVGEEGDPGTIFVHTSIEIAHCTKRCRLRWSSPIGIVYEVHGCQCSMSLIVARWYPYWTLIGFIIMIARCVNHLLREYCISRDMGFLGVADDPPSRLPSAFDPWEHLAVQVPVLLSKSMIREAVEKMPHLQIHNDTFSELKYFRRAHLVLAILTHAYVYGGELCKKAETLPVQLAVPFWIVANRLQMPPVLCHASYVLCNWDRLKLCPFDELPPMLSFTGTQDEQWFIMVTWEIERIGASVITGILECLVAVQCLVRSACVTEGRFSKVVSSNICIEDLEINVATFFDERMQGMTKTIEALRLLLLRMPERCRPDVFFNKLRPCLSGWSSAPGLLYEGVAEEPKYYAGGSAAQSSLLQLVDAALGIVHQQQFMRDMRLHMPAPHRELLEGVDEIHPLSTDSLLLLPLAAGDKDKLLACRSAFVESVERFRSAHIQIVARYIVVPKGKENATRAVTGGTGGTNVVGFLKEIREDTRKTRD